MQCSNVDTTNDAEGREDPMAIDAHLHGVNPCLLKEGPGSADVLPQRGLEFFHAIRSEPVPAWDGFSFSGGLRP